MPTASIKFTQGATTDIAGRALFGIAGPAVVASNGDNTGVVRWVWTVLDAPPGSAVPVGVLSDGGSPTVTFSPDKTMGYLLRLDAYDAAGRVATDERVFGVKNAAGRFIAPAGAAGAALNFGGQLRGWSPYQEKYDLAVDGQWVTGDRSRVFSFNGELATPDATTVTAVAADVNAAFVNVPAVIAADAIVSVLAADGSDRARFVLAGMFAISPINVVTQDGATTVSFTQATGGAGAWTAILDTDGTLVRVRVTGQAARDLRWQATMQLSGRGA